jgi:hypothetical protein
MSGRAARRDGDEEEPDGEVPRSPKQHGRRNRRRDEARASEEPLTRADLQEVLQELQTKETELEARENSSNRRLKIARNNAAIFLTWFGVLAVLVVALLLFAAGVDYLIWFTRQSLNNASPSTQFPAGATGLVTPVASGLNAIAAGWLWKKARHHR